MEMLTDIKIIDYVAGYGSIALADEPYQAYIIPSAVFGRQTDEDRFLRGHSVVVHEEELGVTYLMTRADDPLDRPWVSFDQVEGQIAYQEYMDDKVGAGDFEPYEPFEPW